VGREKLLQLFRAAVETHLGENGGALVEREFGKIPVLNDTTLEQFYAAVARSAKLLAGPSRIELMLSDMRRAVRSILSPP
jgi:hypothetical protein